MNVIRKYFQSTGGQFFIYNNLIKTDQLRDNTMHRLLSHENSLPLGGQYRPFDGKSISLLIHEAIRADFGDLTDKRVLDLGTSIGHYAVLMQEEGAYVTAIDSEQMKVDVLNSIIKLRGLPAIKTIKKRVEDYVDEYSGKFDLILMHCVFDYIQPEKNTHVLMRLSEMSNRLYTTIHIDPQFILDNTLHTQYRKLIPQIYGIRDLWAFWH